LYTFLIVKIRMLDHRGVPLGWYPETSGILDAIQDKYNYFGFANLCPMIIYKGTTGEFIRDVR